MVAAQSFTSKLYPHHLKEFAASGLSLEQVQQAGHESIDPSTARLLGFPDRVSILFNYFDTSGKPYTRSDGKPWKRVKPGWTVEELEEDDEKPKYLSSKDEGCRPYYSRLADWSKVRRSTKIPVLLTEGEKKSDKACADGFPTIGLGGVSSWVDRRSGKPKGEPIPELDEIEWAGRKTFICFDSDIVEKPGVSGEVFKLSCHLADQCATPYVVLLPNEIDGSKNGLDDFLVRHGREAFEMLLKAAQEAVEYQKTDSDEKTGESKNVYKRTYQLEPKQTHLKAVAAWSVLKESWAFRPAVGWYEWDKTHWVYRSEQEFEEVLTQFMDAQNWIIRDSGKVTSILREVRSRLVVRDERWQQPGLMGFSNGVMDLNTGVFQSHSPSHYLTAIRPFDYDPIAQCPTWMKFLNEATGGGEDMIGLLQALIKWTLTPKDRNKKFEIEKSPLLIGRKGTGKGTFLDILVQLVGENNIGAGNPESLKTPEARASLIGKLVALDSDCSGFEQNVGDFNKICSNEPVTVRRLYRDSSEMRLGVVVWRAMNRFLSVPEGSEGLDRRLLVIPFENTPQEIDLELSDKLRAELSGIFNWCWNLSDAEMKRRIMWSGQIGAVAEASVQRFEANNPEFVFLSETFSDGFNAVKASELYGQYKQWCEDNGHKPKSQTRFSPIIQQLGCQKSTKTGGCFFYDIPRMSDFDVAAHLGIKRNVKPSSKATQQELLVEVPQSVAEELIAPQSASELKKSQRGSGRGFGNTEPTLAASSASKTLHNNANTADNRTVKTDESTWEDF